MDDNGRSFGPAPEWLPLAEAAARMGLTVDALRHRIRAREIEARKGNDGKWQVLALRTPPASEPPALRERVASLEAELAEARAKADRLAAELVEARVEGARAAGELLALRERAASDRAMLEEHARWLRLPAWRRWLAGR